MIDSPTHTNHLDMTFHRIEPGSFLMGNDRPLDDAIVRLAHWRYGDADERPVHRVRITQPYYLAATPVTNAQFEAFDPDHRAWRGYKGFSANDDEAVVFVTWAETVAFCEWLSQKENQPYRLPTEAEWEYACRAGTRGAYWTGEALPAEFHNNPALVWYPRVRDAAVDHPVTLTVGDTRANPWGLRDMHGLVEEWCQDWYGPYWERPQVDPCGPRSGDSRVTRGGAHSTELYYLRSANRSSNLPGDRSWYVGFRVALAEPLAAPSWCPPPRLARHQSAVDPVIGPVPPPRASAPAPAGPGTASDLGRAWDADPPFFRGPLKYVHIPEDQYGPLFVTHNHDPGFAVCPNGDLLAIWYTCVEEPGRELSVAASRLRYDRQRGAHADAWEPASLFWSTADKNDHCPALYSDGRRLYHFAGLSAGASWGPLATVLRTSDDSGATWSPARIIIPDHDARHMPIDGVFQLADGALVLPCDALPGQDTAGTALWLSEDQGETWHDAGGTIAGIHAGVVELADGRLLAYGRGADIDGMMARSVSSDRGASWSYDASPFPGIRSGQRIVLRRLHGTCAGGTDPLLLIAFANAAPDSEQAFRITDAAEASRPVTGMYTALSFDDGETWPRLRLVSDDLPDRPIEGTDGRPALMGLTHAEPGGYLSADQAPDGTVHLITSRNHYRFNLAWLCQRPPGL